MKLITLDKRPKPRFCMGTSGVWGKAAPFFINPRGILLHRVHSVTSYGFNRRFTHYAVRYWCGNGTTADGEFTDDPPESRLLCSVCEAVAVGRGQATSESIAGHHVHIGKLRAVRTCCPTDEN